MDMRWPMAIALLYLTGVLSSGGHDSSESCPGEQLSCGEGPHTSSDKISGISLVSHTAKPNEASSSGRPDATRRKRGRRTGFSYEDVAADESFQPHLALFQDSLSGRSREQLASDGSGVISGPDSSTDPAYSYGMPATSRAKSEEQQKQQQQQEEEHDKTLRNTRRTLAVTDPPEDPTLYPNGGTYHHPIAVSLVSTDGSIIYYTTDGTTPEEASDVVKSGELIVLDESATIRAIAAYGGANLDIFASAEVQADFVVYSAGKCGHAYFVPHFTSSGYSGKVVEVDLNTNALGSVRLHGVVTDFADFYATGGVGPYSGQVVVEDLAADGDSDLTGYWGGFSGNVNGTALGFLSPLFNGGNFHGKAVQIKLGSFAGTNVTRFCGSGGALESNATCFFTVLDLEEVDDDLRGFSGGFVDDSKAYFVPSHNGRGGGAKFVRVDAGNFSSGNVEVLDLQTVDPEVGGFLGGFSWERYGYLVPSRSFQGPVGGVNTNLTADGSAEFSPFLGHGVAGSQRPAGRLQPAYSGKLVRVDLGDFSASGVQVLDLTDVDPDLRGFSGGFAAGHWGFLVPYKNKEADGNFSGKMVRFDLRTFDLAGVTVLDLTRVNQSLRGFVGGFTHGRYAILSPYANGNTTGNYRGRSQFGQMVAVDLTDFTVAGVSVVDLAATSRQQIPYQPDPNLRGYVGGFSLGKHVYLTPHFNGIFFGKVVRVDMREMLTMAAGKRAASYDGLQVLDLELESNDAVGFSGAFHSLDTGCS